MAPRMLVVEDSVVVARTLERLLQPHADVVVAGTAAAAERAIASPPWSAMVFDLCLPDGHGLDVLEKAREGGYHGPALVFSGYHDIDDINRAFELGARYLVKPGTTEAIMTFVGNALRTNDVIVDWWRKRYGLTAAEKEILLAAMQDKNHAEITQERGTSAKTTKSHIRNLLAKTGDVSLMALMVRVLKERN